MNTDLPRNLFERWKSFAELRIRFHHLGNFQNLSLLWYGQKIGYGDKFQPELQDEEGIDRQNIPPWRMEPAERQARAIRVGELYAEKVIGRELETLMSLYKLQRVFSELQFSDLELIELAMMLRDVWYEDGFLMTFREVSPDESVGGYSLKYLAENLLAVQLPIVEWFEEYIKDEDTQGFIGYFRNISTSINKSIEYYEDLYGGYPDEGRVSLRKQIIIKQNVMLVEHCAKPDNILVFVSGKDSICESCLSSDDEGRGGDHCQHEDNISWLLRIVRTIENGPDYFRKYSVIEYDQEGNVVGAKIDAGLLYSPFFSVAYEAAR